MPPAVICQCKRCKAPRDPEQTRTPNGGKHVHIGGKPAFFDSQDGTVLYLMEVAQPCSECGDDRVLLGISGSVVG